MFVDSSWLIPKKRKGRLPAALDIDRRNMPIVQTSAWFNFHLDKVYEIAKDSERYPEYIKDVQSLTPVERDGNRFVAYWVGVVPSFLLKVRWRQEEIWDDETHTSKFRQLKGDYDKLEGSWTFKQENGGTRFDQYLDYEYK